MARVLRILILLALLGLALSVVSQTQGNLRLQWQGIELQATPLGTMLIVFGLAFAGWVVIGGLRRLFTIGRRARLIQRKRANEKGLAALNQAFLALAKGDTQGASRHQRAAERQLPHLALPLLLGAQIATQQQDSKRQQQLLQRMLDIPDARPLAARSLLAEALARDDLQQAQSWAQQALDADPKDPDVQTLRIHLLIRQQAFTQAQEQLQRWRLRRQIRRRTAQELEGLLSASEGKVALQRRDYSGAIRLLEHALKLRNHWLPALLPLAESYYAHQQTADLKKLVEKQWKHAPHPRLSELHRMVHSNMAPHLYLKSVQSITRANPDAVESLLWLSHAAERASNWELAHDYARKAVLAQQCRETHTQLANLEQRLHPNQHANAIEQRAKAAAANLLQWHCQRCSTPAQEWQAECPHCHSAESLEWNKPVSASITLLAAA
jgi:HemY protein